MGELIDFAQARGGRDARLAAAAVHAVMHPALRWQVGADQESAHRRTPLGRSVCGVIGRLRLAAPGVPLCEQCYPAQWMRRHTGTA